jgi:hypothetical protein
MGDVYRKMENKTGADMAYRRSADIFRSFSMETEAAEVESRIGE